MEYVSQTVRVMDLMQVLDFNEALDWLTKVYSVLWHRHALMRDDHH